MWPLMDVGDLVGASWLPTDGQASPSDITQSLAKGARMHGARIVEGVRVTGFRDGAVAGSRMSQTTQGDDRLRQGRQLRRPMGAAGRRDGRHRRAAAAGQAPVYHHRKDRRAFAPTRPPCAIPTGAPISRRRSAASSWAATSRTRSAWTTGATCPTTGSSACSTTTTTISSSTWSRRSRACPRWPMSASSR